MQTVYFHPRYLDAVISNVHETTFAHLTDDDAHHEDLSTADELREILRLHYPTITDGDPVQVATFQLTEHLEASTRQLVGTGVEATASSRSAVW